MKSILSFFIFVFFMSASLLANSQAPSYSKPIAKDECAIAYQLKNGAFEFITVKKKFIKQLDQDEASRVCNDKLLKSLKLTPKDCNLYCNPNPE